MNIRFLVTAAVAMLALGAFAQGKPPAGGQQGGQHHMGPGGHMGMSPELKKELNLTPAQEKKITAIREKYLAKLKAAGFTPGQRPANGTRPDMKKLQPIFQAEMKEMNAVYTPKQQAILKKWRETHQMGRGFGGPGRPGGQKGPGGPAGSHHGG